VVVKGPGEGVITGEVVVDGLTEVEITVEDGVADVWAGEGIRLDVTGELYVGLQAVKNKDTNRIKQKKAAIDLFILIPFNISNMVHNEAHFYC
jgi:hypothetical protein